MNHNTFQHLLTPEDLVTSFMMNTNTSSSSTANSWSSDWTSEQSQAHADAWGANNYGGTNNSGTTSSSQSSAANASGGWNSQAQGGWSAQDRQNVVNTWGDLSSSSSSTTLSSGNEFWSQQTPVGSGQHVSLRHGGS